MTIQHITAAEIKHGMTLVTGDGRHIVDDVRRDDDCDIHIEAETVDGDVGAHRALWYSPTDVVRVLVTDAS